MVDDFFSLIGKTGSIDIYFPQHQDQFQIPVLKGQKNARGNAFLQRDLFVRPPPLMHQFRAELCFGGDEIGIGLARHFPASGRFVPFFFIGQFERRKFMTDRFRFRRIRQCTAW